MKIVTFGEVLLRLSAPGYSRLFQENKFNATFCGGEVNVAVSVANYGADSYFITALPLNNIGKAVLNTVRSFGVDMSHCLWREGRLGLYYHENGASQRASQIIYDRKNSTFSQLKSGDISWEKILTKGDWLHFTGINPALGDNIVEVCIQACEVAKKVGAIVSCDLNYRAKLWSEVKAQNIMKDIMPFIDVCIANEEDIEKTLGIKKEKTNVEKGELDVDEYLEIASEVTQKYGCKYVAISLRKSINANINQWGGILYSQSDEK